MFDPFRSIDDKMFNAATVVLFIGVIIQIICMSVSSWSSYAFWSYGPFRHCVKTVITDWVCANAEGPYTDSVNAVRAFTIIGAIFTCLALLCALMHSVLCPKALSQEPHRCLAPIAGLGTAIGTVCALLAWAIWIGRDGSGDAAWAFFLYIVADVLFLVAAILYYAKARVSLLTPKHFQ